MTVNVTDEATLTFTTSEAAERIGVKTALLATRLASGAHWPQRRPTTSGEFD